MPKQILSAGIRASGKPHIGNYLGAIRQFIQLQNEYECYFFIADLHSLTTPFEPKELRKLSFEVAADYLALGLDSGKNPLFLQSQIPEHLELAWIFNSITPIGELERMTQFKDKAKDTNTENINLGLLSYPVLMAADILIYKGMVVPVGEDQVQHIELARTIARKFNSRFGKIFPEPKPLLSKIARVKSLTHPEKKMSKTGDEALLIDDSLEEIHRKLKKAVTATDAKGASAGVENLMMLLKEFGAADQVSYFGKAMKDNTIKYSELKEVIGTSIAEHFKEYREKKKELLADPQRIAEALQMGAEKAREKARETLREVKEKIGLI